MTSVPFRPASNFYLLTAVIEEGRPPASAGRVRRSEVVGTGRFELPTCRLGGDRSIHLSYVPAILFNYNVAV